MDQHVTPWSHLAGLFTCAVPGKPQEGLEGGLRDSPVFNGLSKEPSSPAGARLRTGLYSVIYCIPMRAKFPSVSGDVTYPINLMVVLFWGEKKKKKVAFPKPLFSYMHEQF